MKKHLKLILEILIILAALSYYTIFVVIPEYKSKLGSSDRIINTSKYKTMIEIDIDNSIDFAYVLDKDMNLYHLMFFNENASFLYNKNIENNKLDNAINKTIKILIQRDLLKYNSTITIIYYTDIYKNNFINIFKNSINKYGIEPNIIQKDQKLKDKARELKLTYSTNDIDLLRQLEYFSKNIVTDTNLDTSLELNSKTSKKYTDIIYLKISQYITSNNIKYLTKDNTEFIIYFIEAKDNLYPSQNSWYYVNDGKITAYIELIDNDKKYGYCYNGSINNYKKGEC